jgi:ribosomal small subunit protein bTHX
VPKKKGGVVMGKGDKRTRRGKIFAGSFGKYRLKKSNREPSAQPPVQETTPSEPDTTEETSEE